MAARKKSSPSHSPGHPIKGKISGRSKGVHAPKKARTVKPAAAGGRKLSATGRTGGSRKKASARAVPERTRRRSTTKAKAEGAGRRTVGASTRDQKARGPVSNRITPARERSLNVNKGKRGVSEMGQGGKPTNVR